MSLHEAIVESSPRAQRSETQDASGLTETDQTARIYDFRPEARLESRDLGFSKVDKRILVQIRGQFRTAA